MANLKRRIAERQKELKRLNRDIDKGYIHGYKIEVAKVRMKVLETQIKVIGDMIKHKEWKNL